MACVALLALNHGHGSLQCTNSILQCLASVAVLESLEYQKPITISSQFPDLRQAPNPCPQTLNPKMKDRQSYALNSNPSPASLQIPNNPGPHIPGTRAWSPGQLATLTLRCCMSTTVRGATQSLLYKSYLVMSSADNSQLQGVET